MMCLYEFIGTKCSLPKNLSTVKRGIVKAHGEKKAELKLKRKYRNVLIVRKIEA